MQTHLVYMTAGKEREARTIARHLVENKLAACVNMIPGMQSIYTWEDQIQEDGEIVLIAKTTATQLPKLIEAVKKMHSYDCPCIVALPITAGNPAFLEWIKASTA